MIRGIPDDLKDDKGELNAEGVLRYVGKDMKRLLELEKELAEVKVELLNHTQGIARTALNQYDAKLREEKSSILRVYPGTGFGHT